MNFDILKQAGIDVDQGIARFLGDTALYEKLLNYFLEDKLLERATVSYGNNDVKQLFCDIHEMKGLSANMYMVPLNKASCDIVDMIRGNTVTDEGLAKNFEAFKSAYENTKKAIVDSME